MSRSIEVTKSSSASGSSSGAVGAAWSDKSSKSSTSDFVDLAFRSSLSKDARLQQEGLKRVPSCGGTSALDMTVNDDEFFNNGRFCFEKWRIF